MRFVICIVLLVFLTDLNLCWIPVTRGESSQDIKRGSFFFSSEFSSSLLLPPTFFIILPKNRGRLRGYPWFLRRPLPVTRRAMSSPHLSYRTAPLHSHSHFPLSPLSLSARRSLFFFFLLWFLLPANFSMIWLHYGPLGLIEQDRGRGYAWFLLYPPVREFSGLDRDSLLFRLSLELFWCCGPTTCW